MTTKGQSQGGRLLGLRSPGVCPNVATDPEAQLEAPCACL